MPEAIVIIPTYNEAENLPTLIVAIWQSVPEMHILISDDNSPDGTADAAERLFAGKNGFVLRRTGLRGYGRACVDGFQWAMARDYAFILTMDADWSHDPKYLPDLLAAGRAGNDLTVGSRYCNGVSVVNWPLRRLILSAFANRYVRVILGLHAKDCTSGFRCYSLRALHAANLEAVVSDGYSFLVELMTRIARAGMQIGETPIIFVERRAGQSKMSKKVIYESVWMPWRLRFTRLKKSPLVLNASSEQAHP